MIINIHGGPEGQSRPGLNSSHLMNEMGIAQILPNVRGSPGYGKTYLKLDNAERREDSVKDIGGLLDWIAKQPDSMQSGWPYRRLLRRVHDLASVVTTATAQNAGSTS